MARSTLPVALFAFSLLAASCGSIPENEYVAFGELHEHLQSGIPWAVRTAAKQDPKLVARLPKRADGTVAFEGLRVHKSKLPALDAWWGRYIMWEREVGVREASASLATDAQAADSVLAARRSRETVYRQLVTLLESRPQ